MVGPWPDDASIEERRRRQRASLALGCAVCPGCGREHWKCGRMHRDTPWTQRPLCIACKTPLLMPSGKSSE